MRERYWDAKSLPPIVGKTVKSVGVTKEHHVPTIEFTDGTVLEVYPDHMDAQLWEFKE